MYDPTSLVVALIILGLRTAVTQPFELLSIVKKVSTKSKSSSKKQKGGMFEEMMQNVLNGDLVQ